jgi:prophage antirepressor-like protein
MDALFTPIATSTSIDLFGSTPVSRITDQEGNPWWYANEVCSHVGLTNVSQVVSRLDDHEKSTIIVDDGALGGPPRIIIKTTWRSVAALETSPI